MTADSKSDDRQSPDFVNADLKGSRFVNVTLAGARFSGADLSGVVMRGVDVAGADLDAPWLNEDGSVLLVNGVDVAPLVEAELNRRFPGRADRRAPDPEGLRAAWGRLEQAWGATMQRAATMPAGSVDVSVGGEWSFAQTLRHLVMATDVWLGLGILEMGQPFHPVGLPDDSFEADGRDMAVFTTGVPAYAEVLEARTERTAMVRDYLAAATAEVLAEPRRNPHSAQHPETVLSCLHVILNEEWEHHRFAVRDLDTIDAGRTL